MRGAARAKVRPAGLNTLNPSFEYGFSTIINEVWHDLTPLMVIL